MKRHTAILLTLGLCLLALMSCAPVEYPTALDRTIVEDKPVIYVTPHAKKADISFTPVRNADSYKITLNEVVQNVPLKVKDGLYTFTLRKLTPTTPYELKITALNSKGAQDSTHKFKTTEDNGELEYNPKAYMSQRHETDTTVRIEKLPQIEYRVAFNRNGVWEIVPEDAAKTGLYLIEGLDKNTSYQVRVDHKKTTDKAYSSEFTDLTIPKFRKAFDDSVKLTLVGTKIKVNDIKSKTYMTLLFYPDGTGVPTIIETKGTEDRFFEIGTLGAFKSGLFDVVLTNSSDDSPIFSQPEYLTTPILPVKNTTESHQTSVTLTWTQPDDIEDIIYTVSGNSTDNKWAIKPSEVEVAGNTATLKLDDLVSNTEYELHIEALLPNEEKSNTTYTFTTESFSGVYRWVCPTPNAKVPSFVIEVWDEEDAKNKGWEGTWNKDFPYHVFVHESDPAYSENMKGVPIMPLFESNEEIPSENISYANGDKHFQIGYRWNEAKWNTTTQKPAEWHPVKNDIEGDHIASYCDSWPMIGKVSTKTNFDFRVKDGKPQLVFRNAGDGPKAGFVNLGLFKNPSPEPGTDKFTYVLNRIGSVE